MKKTFSAVLFAAAAAFALAASAEPPSTAERVGESVGGFFHDAGAAVARGAKAVGHASADAYHGLKRGLSGDKSRPAPKPAPKTPAPVVPPADPTLPPAGHGGRI